MNKIPVIVVPTIRDEEFFSSFLDAWKEEFSGCHLIVVEDRPSCKLDKLVSKNAKENGYTSINYCWNDMDNALGSNSWIISRKSDTVRNFGFLMAMRNSNPLFICTLDDDTKPLVKGHIQQFYNNLFTDTEQDKRYFSTMNTILPRGKLLSEPRKVGIVHGCWTNVPDLDAKTQIDINGTFVSKPRDFYCGYVPYKALYSMCGMNIAFRPELTKYMFFPMMGAYNKHPIDRCADIWTGFYSKTKLDELGYAVYTGEPFVEHTRASNSWSNLNKEKGEDYMGREFLHCIIENNEPRIHKEYFNKIKEAYKIWGELIDNS